MGYDPSTDEETIELRLGTGERVNFWESYSFTTDFLTPSDSWSFTIGDEHAQDARAIMPPGTSVFLVVNDRGIASGYIDKAPFASSRAGGTTMTIQGRDKMSRAVDGCVQPFFVFKPGQTLLDLMAQLFTPFGFRVFSTTNDANRDVITGNDPTKIVTSTQTYVHQDMEIAVVGGAVDTASVAGTPVTVSTQYDPTRPKFWKDLPLSELRPHFGEGVFEFAARMAKRLNLWIWPNAVGDTIIVGAPDFEQAPRFRLVHSPSKGICDYESASLDPDLTNQPSVIVATGGGSGGDAAHAPLKCAMVNELVGLDATGNILPDVAALIAAVPGCKTLPIRTQMIPFAKLYASRPAVACYLPDEESHTPGQLEGFVRTEMAKRQYRAFVLTATLEGHTQNGQPWAVDTMVDVQDDTLQIYERLWVKSVTLSKNRTSGGTSTKVELVRPYTIEFGAKIAS